MRKTPQWHPIKQTPLSQWLPVFLSELFRVWIQDRQSVTKLHSLYIFSIFSAEFAKSPQSKTLQKSPQWEPSCWMRKDRQTYDMVKLMVASRNFSTNRLHSASYSLRHLAFKHKVILVFTYLIGTCCNICSSYFRLFFLYPYYCKKI